MCLPGLEKKKDEADEKRVSIDMREQTASKE